MLQSRHAFSCGNLFPFIAQEGGAVVISLFNIDEGLPSFTSYFDDARLDEMMDDYFQGQEELEDAA